MSHQADTIFTVNGHNSAGLPVPPALGDTVPVDTLSEPVYALIIENHLIDEPRPEPRAGEGAMSWIWLGILALFVVVALKFKNNYRYLKAVGDDLTDIRVRQNAFDETVKETSFLVLLNLLWVVCAGVLLWKTVMVTTPHSLAESFGIRDNLTLGIGICVGVSAAYVVMMFLAYWLVGRVFTDKMRARMWLKGAGASQGLEVILLFPLALLTLCYEPWTLILLEISACGFILGKIVFIYKGFRIFFNQFSSWMLFLYYLCSIEIVPLVLTYVATLQICSQWL
ncbi:MAG: DUF4271 domain-containing protein [Muribaculaceae bacterium]|nr:DUF4271 domain-containing protein [Muribaculaceae bacterium]